MAISSVDCIADGERGRRPQPPSKGPEMTETKTVNLSASARLVAGALAEAHETTVVVLTETAGVSKSTVAKTLALLERAGAARRTVRESDGVREADLWSPGPGLGALLFTVAADGSYAHAETLLNTAEATPSVTTAPGRSETPEPNAQDDGQASAALEETDTDFSNPAAGNELTARLVNQALTAAPRQNDTVQPEAVQAERAPAATSHRGVQGRLAPGGLTAMVAAALAAHPDIEYTPTQLSHLLGGRSAGAIHNVLEKMIKTGSAIRTCDKPKRYRHAPA
jgi:hypothetical protein